ncbi:MAG TPA: methyl-accepting chemotaxis protein [Bacteroidota bacterium]|nr:methyl-accepting chemotaxis protein [Bacteroidota bacterium]
MQWLSNLKIRTKILMGFILVALLAATVGYMGLTNIESINAADVLMYEHMTVPIASVTEMTSSFQQIRVSYRDVILARNDEEVKKYIAALKEFDESLRTADTAFASKIIASQVREAFDQFVSAHDAFVPFQDRVVSLAAEGRKSEAIAVLRDEKFVNASNAQKRALQKLAELEVAAAQVISGRNASLARGAITFMLLVMGFVVLVALSLGFFIAIAISKPLRDLVERAVAVASGDLTVRVPQRSKDEVGRLASSFQMMVDSLRQTIGRVDEASSAVASATTEISSSTEEMAAGAQEQNSQAGEVATAVEEMTKTILENSRNSNNTAETAKKVKTAAEEGGKVVLDTVDGMKRIAEVVRKSAATVTALGQSSSQIGEIVIVIDDIADQTNLLALNAAIEAARAGDQGRGFAVVADEVRKLAERTTKATKEIGGMIKTIQVETAGAVAAMQEGTREVDDGIRLADLAGKSLHDIVGMVQNLTDLVSQIAAASEEQSSASEEISKNVEAISSVTSQTATGVQQIARAADDLNRLTEILRQLIGGFHLSDKAGEGRTGDPKHTINGTHLGVGEIGKLTGISGGQQTLDIHAAKRAHLAWRTRIQNLVAGKERIAEGDVVSHRDCQLGKWYYSSGQSELGNNDVFRKLGETHQEMHNLLRSVVKSWNEGRNREAKSHAEKVYDLSDRVIELLDELSEHTLV